MGKEAAAKPGAAAGGKGKFSNPTLIRGLKKFSANAARSRSGRYKFIKKGAAGKKTEKKIAPVVKKQKKMFEADVVPTPHKSRKGVLKPTKLRSSITPGTVLIVLSGRFRGKRVVFLKQLAKSGLLLVTGPFKVNGVPLRRLNQSLVIATSTKVDISSVKVPDNVDDKYFSTKVKSTNPDDKKAVANARKAEQKAVDDAVEKAIAAVPQLKEYLSARFTLSNNQAPHAMKF